MLYVSIDLLLLLLLLLVMVPHWNRWRSRRFRLPIAALFRLHRIQYFVVLNKVVDEFARFTIFQMLVPHARLLEEGFERFLLAAQIEATGRAPADVRHVLEVGRHADVLLAQASLTLGFGWPLEGLLVGSVRNHRS